MTITIEAVNEWVEAKAAESQEAVDRGERLESPLERLGVVEDGEQFLDDLARSTGDAMTAVILETGMALALDLERQANHVEPQDVVHDRAEA